MQGSFVEYLDQEISFNGDKNKNSRVSWEGRFIITYRSNFWHFTHKKIPINFIQEKYLKSNINSAVE